MITLSFQTRFVYVSFFCVKLQFIVQAVLKHLGHVNADAVVVDEEELHCHQKLQELYSSTKAAKVK